MKRWQFFFQSSENLGKTILKEQNQSMFTRLAKTDGKSINSQWHFWTKTSPWTVLKALGHYKLSFTRVTVLQRWNPSRLEILPHRTTTSSKLLLKEWRKAERQRDLLRLSYLDARMLRVGVRVCTWGRLKRHWTDRTLVEDFTVRTLDVRLQRGHIRVHNIAMHTSVRKQTHGR